MVCRSAVVLIGFTGVILVFAFSAGAQTSGSVAKKTAAPAGWQEKWVGMYAGQDQAGKVTPPGFKVLYAPEPDTIELVDSLLQPWARARQEATDYELEDPGQICRSTGVLSRNASMDFQLAVSPEKITMIGGTGGGILTAGIRRIYMNRPHLKNPPLTYMGDWIGHWEGDTLVLDGIGFNEKTWLTRDRHRHTEALHIVERWRFVSNDEWLERTITVDDRFALTAPYTVTWYFKKRSNETVWPERVCQDTPQSRRAWIKIYKRSLHDWDAERKQLGRAEE